MSFFECEGITMILHFKSVVLYYIRYAYIEIYYSSKCDQRKTEIIWYTYIHFYELSWNAFLFYLPPQNCRIGI